MEQQERSLELMYMHQQYHGIIEKQQYTLRGSKLSCSYGTEYSLLDTSQDHGIYKGNLPVLTTIDCSKSNICGFGSCLCPESNYAGRLPMTVGSKNGKTAKRASYNNFAHICIPMVSEGSAWQQVDHSIMAKTCAKAYVPLLLDSAALICQYGGIIKIVEVPQAGTTQDSGKVVIAVVGEDMESSHNAFKDTMGTFIKDNPSMDIRVIYANEHNSAEHVLQEVILLSKTINGGIDHLRIEAHSDPNGIILKLNDQLVAESDWDKIAFSSSAYIRFTGCNTGGTDGIKSEDSIAQKVSNKTGKTVYGFLNNTSQRYEDGRYFQAPTAMYTGQKVVDEYTKFTPIK